jgi:hypothetical protein
MKTVEAILKYIFNTYTLLLELFFLTVEISFSTAQIWI